MDDTTRIRIGAWAAIALVLAFVAWRALGHGGGGGAVASVSLDEPAGARPSAAASRHGRAPRRRIFVAVAGAVRQPGLYRVPAGARVAVAVARAGGLLRRADLTGVNLAARLRDGQQVVVPERGVGPAGTPAAGATGVGAAGGGAPVSLSTATAEQLDALDGIGPALAQRILEYRAQHGGFRSVDELAQVEGIGEKRLAALRDAVVP